MLTQLRNIEHLQRWCLLGWVIGLASQINIAVTLGDFAPKLAALQLAPTYASFQNNIATWTVSDVERFYAHFGLDLLHPVLYSVALSLNLAWGFRATGLAARYNVWLSAPLIAGCLDLIENCAHYVAVSMYQPYSGALPEPPWWTFGVGCTAAKIKWLIALCTLAALPALAWRARRLAATSDHRHVD